MNGVIVGLGSMGKRRLRLLQQVNPDIVLAGVDFSELRRAEVTETYHIPCYASIAEALEAVHAEIGIVCTSPASHCSIIKELLLYDLDVFTELNLVNKGYAELEALAAERKKTIFMSSTLLYRREVKRIQEALRDYHGPLSYHLHVGQYLPDWHPWERIEDFFVSNPETNGCREIFAIQLPWLIKTFGEVDREKLFVMKQNLTKLPLNFPDSYHVLTQHEKGVCGVIQVDVVSRKPISALTVVGEGVQIYWDGTPGGLSILNLETKQYELQKLYDSFEQNQKYASNIIEDAYADELRSFLLLRRNEIEPCYTLSDDAKLLELIDSIER